MEETNTYEISADEVLHMDDETLAETLSNVAVPQFSGKFRRIQGEASLAKSDQGRLFAVTGPKADAVRALVLLGADLTRKEIAELAGCSVSRVAEVVWGLEHDDIEFPAIPKRRKAAETTEEG